jgi:glycosyltransferase involved in cell wall biosynthesis
MLVVSLVTLGSPEQLTGGYLYHRRMADSAQRHDARIEFVEARWWRPLGKGADVVLLDSIAAAIVAPRMAARRLHRPTLAVLHQPPGGIDAGIVHRHIQAPLDRLAYRRCDVLIAASAALADDLIASHGLDAARIRVIPPGSDVAQAPDGPVDLRDGRAAAFVSVGNWVARKGTLELLDAFSALPHQAATLHLAGRDDVEPRYAARVRARLRDRDLEGRVVVHGALPAVEIARLYAGADAFVLPSYREPYGTVYGEALAAGVPVVGWRAGNLPHLAEDGRDGVILPPGDLAGLAGALHRLASDTAWRERLREGARRRGASLPTWADTAELFFATVREVAERAR